MYHPNTTMEDITLAVPKLVKYGPPMRIRFSEKSRLSVHQREALESVYKWIVERNTVSEERPVEHAAVVSMPCGRTGVVCCLPYYLGGSAIAGMNFNLPILVVCPGRSHVREMAEQLGGKKNFFLQSGILKKAEMRLGYTVFREDDTDPHPGMGTSATPHDIVLLNAHSRSLTAGTTFSLLPDDLFSLVVVHEAHKLLSVAWNVIRRKFMGHSKIIFLTDASFHPAKERIVDGRRDPSTVEYAYDLSPESGTPAAHGEARGTPGASAKHT